MSSTDSFHTAPSPSNVTPTNSGWDVDFPIPFKGLQIHRPAVKGWCPAQYRDSILSWLDHDGDERMQTAFYLYVGAATRYNNSFNMRRSIEASISRLGLSKEYDIVRKRLKTPVNRVPITELRLATAFPDLAFAFHCLSTSEEIITIDLYNRAHNFTMPAVLTYSQALQLHLDESMQGYANQANRNHWLSIIKSEPEVPDGPDFIAKYFDLCRENKYELYFPPDIFTSGAKTASARLFEAPYNFKQLVAYQRLMSKFNTQPGKLDIHDLKQAFLYIDESRLTPLDTVPSTFDDERRDGAVPRIKSTSVEYSRAKHAVLRGREGGQQRQVQVPVVREPRPRDVRGDQGRGRGSHVGEARVRRRPRERDARHDEEPRRYQAEARCNGWDLDTAREEEPQCQPS